MIKQHSQFMVLLIRLLDLSVTAAAWPVCYWVRFHSNLFSFVEDVPPPLAYVTEVMVICLLLTMLVFSRMGIYRPRRIQSLVAEAGDLVKACLVVWVAVVFINYFLPGAIFSRKLTTIFVFVWPTMMIAYRASVRFGLRFLRRRGRNTRSVAIVGAGRLGQKLFHTLRREAWTGYEIRYFVDDRQSGGLLGLPVHGPLEQVDAIVAERPVDCIFVALPTKSADRLADVLDKLSSEVMDVNVVPDLLGHAFLRHRAQQLGALSVVNLTDNSQRGWNATAKRVLDVVLSLAGLAVLSPLMIAIAIAVKRSSPGPVFYLQRRASLGGREFDIIKFRSMVVGAEKANGAEWAVPKADPRITRVGRLLRRLSLDELPQLINVLKGDMSLVGPRPERPEFIARFSRQFPRYMLRHHVKAGITGWAQVNGFRGPSSLRKRLQYDLDYIERWSLPFDLWILLLTVVGGFRNRS